jgi:alkylation response protein AidB-like acyl-CoA dehydrogenase
VPPDADAAFREAPGLTISAGTSEMMLEMVAGSGLPVPGGDLAGVVEEPLARQLRAAVRRIAEEHADHEDPAAWRAPAEALGLLALEAPVERGGLGLGLAASVIAAEELGRGLLDGGFLAAMAAAAEPDDLARQRIRRAAWLVGLATGALAHTVRRARERRQFGRPIVEHQAVAFALGRCAARVTAGRLLVTDAATAADSGPASDPALAASTLAAAIETAHHVTREAMQLSGAWGMTLAAPVGRHYRAALAASGEAGPARRLWLDSTVTPGGPR